MIILRTAVFSPRTAAFAARLVAESGHRLCCVVDETRGTVDTGVHEKISLTRASCRELGLYCPGDFGWRCGDYGFYLARKRHPRETHFWLIEYDVRLAGLDLGVFFRRFEEAGHVDLIAGHYRQADPSWYWTHTMIARGQPVHRCLFPVVRLSAAAIDLAGDGRRAYASRPLRRANWPNDESFVATTLTRAGLRCADLNDFGATLYDDSTFTFHEPFNGDVLHERLLPSPRIYHPVLFDDDLRRKLARMDWINQGESLPRKLKRRLINAVNSRSAP